MKTEQNKLPQELVEKMKVHTKELHPRSSSHCITAEHCAQIAVDYAEKHKQSVAEKDFSFLKEMKSHAEKAFENNDVSSKEMLFTMIDDWMHELKQLLKKHEDGK